MVTGRTAPYPSRVGLLAVVAGLCLVTGGIVLLPSWLERVRPIRTTSRTCTTFRPGPPSLLVRT